MSIDRSAPVLLVDQRASVLTIISDLLQTLGFETIDTANDSAAALDILSRRGPGLVISDLHVQPMNGVQLLRTIRSDDRLKSTPFIIVADSLSPAEAMAIKSAGVRSAN